LPVIPGVSVWAILLVAWAGMLGWGIRGSYGHERGASFPAAIIALSICLLSGRPDWQQNSLFIAAIAAIGIAYGGSMSYAKVAGYARSLSFPNAAYGLFCLFVVHGLWGGVGGCAFGLALAGWSPGSLLLLAAAIAVVQQISYHLLIDVLKLRMTPPRNENWARCFGAIVLMAVVCVVRHEHAGLVGLTYGFMGWGFGALVGMFVQLVGLGTGVVTNWWRVMEMTIGFSGGAALAVGMLPFAATLPPLPPLPAFWFVVGAYVTLWGIVVLHAQHNFQHYQSHLLLTRGRWAGRSALSLTRRTQFWAAVALAAILIAWHYWGPRDPLIITMTALIGLAAACALLVVLLDVWLPAGARRERAAQWYIVPFLVLVAGVLALPLAFAGPPRLALSLGQIWSIALPLAIVLSVLFAAFTRTLWEEESIFAHRRFGRAADPGVYVHAGFGDSLTGVLGRRPRSNPPPQPQTGEK
jgi:hypothetical protein